MNIEISIYDYLYVRDKNNWKGFSILRCNYFEVKLVGKIIISSQTYVCASTSSYNNLDTCHLTLFLVCILIILLDIWVIIEDF